MANRIIELETKARTPVCEILENEYRDNLADLRVLVAKEYCTMLIGETNNTVKLLIKPLELLSFMFHFRIVSVYHSVTSYREICRPT